MRYPWQLLNRLAGRFEVHQVDKAHGDLDRVLDVIGQGSRPLDLRKLRCAQVMSFCVRGAHAAAAPSPDLLGNHIQTLDRLAHARSWRATRELMHNYLSGLFTMTRAERRTDVERFVQQMRKDMRSTLESPRSLVQYAEAGGLSVGHLSRCFAVAAGLPFRQELRRLRLAEARRLLTATTLKISVIARRVGLRDASQFSADFRNEMGVTPSQFRRRRIRRRSVPAVRG